jgi:di/tricarboxylate transporter
MTAEIALVLVILGIAIVLFASERIRVDVIAMMVLLTLLFTGLVDTDQAFSGFSNPAVITVWAIYVVSAGLTRTGVADYIGQRILRVAGNTEPRLVAVIMTTVGSLSAFMNNIGATAVLLPAVVTIARKAKVPVSKLLIPLAWGSLVGGVTTLIGTPPNLLVSAALADAGLRPFSLFDYTPMGLIIMVASIAYMALVGRHLLPSRSGHSNEDDLVADYRLRDYLTELRVLPRSPLVGRTIIESELGQSYDLTVMGIVRDGQVQLGVLADATIAEDDLLLVKGEVSQLLQVHDEIGVAIDSHSRLSEVELTSERAAVAEVIVSQKADFIGKSLAEMEFRGRFGLTVLAIWRQEAPIVGRLDRVPLQLGDTLLVHGRREQIRRIAVEDGFLLLSPVAIERHRVRKAPLALLIFAAMIGLVAAGVLHISAAAVAGMLFMILLGALTVDEAYHAIEWKSVFLIAGMLPMGIAMETTGTAEFLAQLIISTAGDMGPRAIMIGLFILTSIVTEFMSNAAAAVLVAPIAISTALTLGVDPRAFVMGVGIAASNSFLTPIGHQASVLVYGPGNYRFFDYTKVGLPLTLVIWVLVIIFLPMLWPLGG